MSQEEDAERRQKIEHIVIDHEDEMFQEFEELRVKWGLAEDEMAALVRRHDDVLATTYADWLES